MNFRSATDVLGYCISHNEMAKAMGVVRNSVARARLSPRSRNVRTPPAAWEKAIAKLARERAGELVKLAEELEGGAWPTRETRA